VGGAGINMPARTSREEACRRWAAPAAAARDRRDAQTRDESWSKLSKEFQDKFNEIYFHVRPARPSAGAEKKQAGAAQWSHGGRSAAMGGGKDMMGGGAARRSAGTRSGRRRGRRSHGRRQGKRPWESPHGEPGAVDRKAPKAGPTQVVLSDALIRFFDPDVQPGKTYRYSVRIRMANPQPWQGKGRRPQATRRLQGTRVSAQRHARLDHYPEITIPGDYAWYAIDQTRSPCHKGADFKDVFNPDKTPVQIHRWIDRLTDDNGKTYETGDWAIAERLYTRRGEPIGRTRS